MVRGSGILISPPSPWRKGFWTSPSFLWKEVPRRGGGWLSQRDEREWGVARPSFRHPERSRGIFLAGRKTIHMRKSVIPSRMEYGVSRSPHFFCLTGVQERFLDFARNDNKGEGLGYGRLSLCFIGFYFFSQYATSVSTAPMPRAVLIPMPVYMAKEARVAARLAAMSFLKKP